MVNLLSIIFGAVAGFLTGFFLSAIIPNVLRTEEQRVFGGACFGAITGTYAGLMAGEFNKGEKNPNRFLLGLLGGCIGGGCGGFYFVTLFKAIGMIIDNMRRGS
jgi:hypothetical protein